MIQAVVLLEASQGPHGILDRRLAPCLLDGGLHISAQICLALAFCMLVCIGKVARPLQIDMLFDDCMPRQILSALYPNGESGECSTHRRELL